MGPQRLTSLDALRGVAALSVVVWHWQHFFAIDGDWMEGWRRDMQPLFWLLKPLYVQGWAAVDLFFVLSGFVFFWLYGEQIRACTIGVGRFAQLRASRLYPLHLVLLLAVALGQYLFWRMNEGFFIYDANDLPHFLAQLFLVQNWYFDAPQSFDGPAWSVSLECLLYAVFFVCCRWLGVRAGWRALAVALFAVPLIWRDEHIARGFIGFFMGGAMVGVWQALRRHARVRLIGRGFALAALGGWTVLLLLLYGDSPLVAGGEGNEGFLLAFDLGLCPLTVLALALNERGADRPLLGFLGDISYSTYLLHFPMQLALALLAGALDWTPLVFMQGWVMAAFYAALVGLGALSYYGFERPMQRVLRKLRVTNRAVAA
jgi:peptidoglycan/LPS O-acetylase OafA/YrhL